MAIAAKSKKHLEVYEFVYGINDVIVKTHVSDIADAPLLLIEIGNIVADCFITLCAKEFFFDQVSED